MSGAVPQPPRSAVETLFAVVRADATPALLIPVIVGAALAWWEAGTFDLWALAVTLLGLTATAWGFTTFGDFFDFRRTLQPGMPNAARHAPARHVADPLYDGFGLMERGRLAPQRVRNLGLALFGVAALCSLGLYLMAGWPALFFCGLSFVVLWAVLLLPLKYDHHGWGAGESGIFLGLGWLPAVCAYYVQAGSLTWLPIWAALPFALLTVLQFLNYDNVHYRRDWMFHKRTPAVNLGLARAIDLSALLTVLAHVGILLVVVLTDLPLVALLALAALPLGLGVFARLMRDDLTLAACLAVYRTGIQGTVITGLLFCLALLLDKLV
jgi:1,4-dihydroxy-2-naphthoate octaprenyltransferase